MRKSPDRDHVPLSSVTPRRDFLRGAARRLASIGFSNSPLVRVATVAATSAGVTVGKAADQSTRLDVDWLSEVQRPPRSVPRDAAGHLEPLLVTADGTAIATLSQWRSRRRSLRSDWMRFLGPMPPSRPPITLKILAEDRPTGCVRQLVRYECEPGIPVEAYLLKPAEPLSGTRRAGLVALHPTTSESIDEIAGVSGREAMQLGLKLCRLGFVVCCPRCFLWQKVSNYQEAVARFRGRHPRTLGMHKMLYDAVRAVDVLEGLPEVDRARIGAVGHSLGGKEVLYLAAFDERIKAAVASEGGLTFRSTNWDAPWYLGDGIHAPGFKLNHHQLLALTAPRALLVLAGEQGRGAADGDRSWPLIESALPVYRLYGAPPRLGLYNHRQGHAISDAAFQRLAEWLTKYVPL